MAERKQKLPKAIICDLDGTLALLGDRSPYDHMRADEDIRNDPVAKVVTTFYDLGYHIIFVSGRKEESREITKKWLRDSIGGEIAENAKLYMRADRDNRKDVLVKQDFYRKFIRGKYEIEFVLDDRDQVVEFWRREGLTCFQVAYGNF